jgi:hypothetical protein
MVDPKTNSNEILYCGIHTISGLMTKVILSGQIDIDIMSIYLYSTVRTGAGEYHLRKNRDNDV